MLKGMNRGNITMNQKMNITMNNTTFPNAIKGKYFVTLPEGLRYIFNKKGSEIEATYISLILSELHSLRFVQPKAAQYSGNFLASISDISFYTGIGFEEVKKALIRLVQSKVISMNTDPSLLTEQDFHSQYIYNIDDNLLSKFSEVGEERFKEARSNHVREKLSAKPSTTVAVEIDPDRIFCDFDY